MLWLLLGWHWLVVSIRDPHVCDGRDYLTITTTTNTRPLERERLCVCVYLPLCPFVGLAVGEFNQLWLVRG